MFLSFFKLHAKTLYIDMYRNKCCTSLYLATIIKAPGFFWLLGILYTSMYRQYITLFLCQYISIYIY